MEDKREKIKCVGVRPRVVVYPFFMGGYTDLIIGVANIGKVDVTISAVALFNDKGIMIENIPLSIPIRAGETKNIQVTIDHVLQKGRTYKVVIVTSKGTEAKYSLAI